MKILNIILKVLLCLLMVSPILGVTGLFPAPTADMYNTTEGFEFIDMLMSTGYITWIMAIVFVLSFVLIVMGRTALAALLILPITVNIVAFHLFLDGGIFVMSALMGNVIFALNIYFLWLYRAQYKSLFVKA